MEIHCQNAPQNLQVSMDTDKHGHTEVIRDLYFKLPGKIYRDLLKVKVNGTAESYMLPLRTYKRMFPNNLTIDGLPRPDALLSATHIILDFYTDGIFPVFGILILKVACHRTGKLMPI